MIILKQVIQYTTTNGCEATWVDRTVAPDTVIPAVPAVPEVPAVLDADGNVTTPAIPAVPAVLEQIIPGAVTDVQVKCHSYADVQMQMFRDDAAAFGTPLDDYEDMIADIESKIVPYVPPPPQVPQVISMRQARLALLGAGLLSTVEAAINAQAEPTKSALRIEWDYATEVARNWPTLLALQPALGLTNEQVDDLFSTASQL